MSRLVKVQVAFQGGGARVFGHLAVAETLEKLSSPQLVDRRIEVTRVAGSSAGALGAVSYAASEKTTDLREKFRRVGKTFLPHFGQRGWLSKFRSYLRLVQGKSYFSEINLQNCFEEVFGTNTKVSDLLIPTLLYFSDLNTKRLRTSSTEDSVAQALADSCNFPFVFSGWEVRSDHLDGGLIQNLPVDDLISGQSEFGEVIAIAFGDESASARERSFLGHVQRMFTTAIDASVHRSIRILGDQNVFRIKTDITTFDFNTAITKGFGEDYKRIREDFEKWLEKWIKKRDDGTHWIKPISNSSFIPRAFLREFEKIIIGREVFCVADSSFVDVAEMSDAGSFTGRYRSRSRSVLRPLIDVQLVKFSVDLPDDDWIGKSGLRAAACHKDGTPLQLQLYVHKERVKGEGTARYSIWFCFEIPLVKDQTYVFEYESFGEDIYPNVGKGFEYSKVMAVLGRAEKITLAIAVPKLKAHENVKQIDLHSATGALLALAHCEDRDRLVKSNELQYADVSEKLNITGRQDFYAVFACEAVDIPKGQMMGFALDVTT